MSEVVGVMVFGLSFRCRIVGVLEVWVCLKVGLKVFEVFIVLLKIL